MATWSVRPVIYIQLIQLSPPPTSKVSRNPKKEGRKQKKQRTMNRYAKIKADSNSKSKSRSLEWSADPKSFSNTTHHSQSPETQELNQIKEENIISRNSDFDEHQEQEQEQQDDSKSGSGFRVKLTRSSSVASNGASQQRFRMERAGSRRVKRVFSMTRSSSVSERYCRIHNQCATLSSPTIDDGDMDSNNGDHARETSPTSAEKISGTVKTTSEKFLRVCKRFLRL